jgi:drug/metabolite transporter (DMT)-like permease
MLNEFLVIVSEVTLSLYPTLIKIVPASVVLQTVVRMLVFTVLAFISAVITRVPLSFAQFLTAETPLTGLLNLVHVGSSYVAFDALAGGNAMSLFYVYPFLNLIGASVLLGETIPVQSIPWLLVAFFGAILVAQPSAANWSMVGVICALLAAATETGIYLWFKTSKETQETQETQESQETQPWTKMFQMYGASSILLLVGCLVLIGLNWIAPNLFFTSGSGFAQMIAFNSIVGFVGYALRFYLIPNVSTVVFSTLSFFGVISAYLFGWVFSNETPTLLQGLGATAIILANTVLLRKEIA